MRLQQAARLLNRDTAQIHAIRWFSLNGTSSLAEIAEASDMKLKLWPETNIWKIDVCIFSRWKHVVGGPEEEYRLLDSSFTADYAAELDQKMLYIAQKQKKLVRTTCAP
jgi:hypothetical protein